MTGQLRDRLGFQGLIVTDALLMGGITQCGSPGEVCVRALAAGADMLLMPVDLPGAIAAIVAAVQSGQLPEARIQSALARVKAAKAKVARQPEAALTAADLATFDDPSSNATVAAILQASQRQHGRLPLSLPTLQPPRLNLVAVGNRFNCPGLDIAAPALAVPRRHGFETHLCEQAQLDCWQPPASQVLLQIFMRGDPFRGSASLSPAAQDLFKRLLTEGQLLAIAPMVVLI
ncbi:MAG: hypothetical protein HC838_17505 [Spirulinaceae cyanobacterium RM2_2_10]|nr:hypothetical protein [Spirulinaceae cyanobacterium RM2_2_10]